MISFDEAYQLTLDQIQSLESYSVELLDAVGRIAAQDLHTQVDSPSLDVSLKDGYAIHSIDIRNATLESPVPLDLVGSVAAGGAWKGAVSSGQALRILSGAPLPQGADAVLAEEFTRPQPGATGFIQAINHAEPGRNILRSGSDITSGRLIVPAGKILHPTTIGLLAAAGYSQVPVVRPPRVAILATGDEVLSPGEALVKGKLYASNLFTLASWCLHFGFRVDTCVIKDDRDLIREILTNCLEQFDAVLTSGGAWNGERDLVVHILDALGWQKFYHRVRIGPGKAVGFGLFQGKPVFCLPGGPPSNHMAFLQLGLPGLQKLAGYSKPGLPMIPAIIGKELNGQVDWTQFKHGRLIKEDGRLLFEPMRYKSRLQEMADLEAIAKIPEGQTKLPTGSPVMVQVLQI